MGQARRHAARRSWPPGQGLLAGGGLRQHQAPRPAERQQRAVRRPGRRPRAADPAHQRPVRRRGSAPPRRSGPRGCGRRATAPPGAAATATISSAASEAGSSAARQVGRRGRRPGRSSEVVARSGTDQVRTDVGADAAQDARRRRRRGAGPARARPPPRAPSRCRRPATTGRGRPASRSVSGGGDSISPTGGGGRRLPGLPACENTELTTLQGPGRRAGPPGGGSGRVLIRPPRGVSARRSPSRRRRPSPSSAGDGASDAGAGDRAHDHAVLGARQAGDGLVAGSGAPRTTSVPSGLQRRRAGGGQRGRPGADRRRRAGLPDADRAVLVPGHRAGRRGRAGQGDDRRARRPASRPGAPTRAPAAASSVPSPS